MASRVQHYRAELKKRRGEWEPYLKANSGLPGPRANLDLVTASARRPTPTSCGACPRRATNSWRFAARQTRATAKTEPDTVLPWLKELAEGPRWRVREGVAIALQQLGHASMPQLIAEMERWSKGGPLVQRAAAAGLCEPAC